MIYFYASFVFVLGAIVGSFLNVVIYRYNTGLGLGGRSFCNSCSQKLRWFELVPVLSFLVQRARCRRCETKLSWQYIAVEIFTGAVFLLLFLKLLPFIATSPVLAGAEFTFFAVVFSLFIVILVYDLKHTIIPDVFSYSLAALALGHLLIVSPNIPDILAGPILFFPFWFLWIVSKGTWMGLGDAKLALGMGWLLGLYAGLAALLLAFWSGALVAIVILFHNSIIGKRTGLTLKSEIPFAPFLVLGTALAFFLDLSVLQFLLF